MTSSLWTLEKNSPRSPWISGTSRDIVEAWVPSQVLKNKAWCNVSCYCFVPWKISLGNDVRRGCERRPNKRIYGTLGLQEAYRSLVRLFGHVRSIPWHYESETDETENLETRLRLRLLKLLVRYRDWDWDSENCLYEIETATETLKSSRNLEFFEIFI